MCAMRHLSCRETEIDDVSVLNHVLLALQPDLAVITASGHRTAGDQRVVRDHLGSYEPSRNITMNFAGRDLRVGVARDGPGPALVFANREERNVPEEIVGGA